MLIVACHRLMYLRCMLALCPISCWSFFAASISSVAPVTLSTRISCTPMFLPSRSLVVFRIRRMPLESVSGPERAEQVAVLGEPAQLGQEGTQRRGDLGPERLVL